MSGSWSFGCLSAQPRTNSADKRMKCAPESAVASCGSQRPSLALIGVREFVQLLVAQFLLAGRPLDGTQPSTSPDNQWIA